MRAAGGDRLSFEADDLDWLAPRLRDAGYDDATIWDEAYGRVLSVTAPDATTSWVDERSKDLYCCRLHEAHPDERWSVTPILRVADHQAAWEHFLGVLGGDTPELVGYRAPAAGGAVELALRTTQALSEVERRLAAAGRAPTRAVDRLTVEDPDGRLVAVTGGPAGGDLTSTTLEEPR